MQTFIIIMFSISTLVLSLCALIVIKYFYLKVFTSNIQPVASKVERTPKTEKLPMPSLLEIVGIIIVLILSWSIMAST